MTPEFARAQAKQLRRHAKVNRETAERCRQDAIHWNRRADQNEAEATALIEGLDGVMPDKHK